MIDADKGKIIQNPTIESLLNDMTVVGRACYILKYYHDFSYEDLSAVTGRSKTALYKLFSKERQKVCQKG